MSFFVREFLLYKKKYKMSFRSFWVMGTQKVGNSRQKLTKKLGYHRLLGIKVSKRTYDSKTTLWLG
jgi:hypothetical protein